MQEKLAAGPQRLTLIERLLTKAAIPYVLGSLGLALVVGAPGLLLINFLDTGDSTMSVARVLAPYSQRPSWAGPLDLAVNTAIIFYMLLTIRFMRQKLAGAEPKLASLTPGGENTLHKVFGHVSSLKGQLITTLMLLIFIQLLPQNYQSTTSTGPTSTSGIILALVIAVFFYLTVGTFVWAYASSLWSLHQFGKQPLQLRSFRENRLLGVGAVGSLSLTLAISYYTVFGPITFESVILSPDLVGEAVLLPLAALGAVMFFLPLTSIHRRMKLEKQESEKMIREELSKLATATATVGNSQDSDMRGQVSNLVKLHMLQMDEKRLLDIPTWPFEKRSVEILVAIFLSVLTALLTRLVFAALNL